METLDIYKYTFDNDFFYSIYPEFGFISGVKQGDLVSYNQVEDLSKIENLCDLQLISYTQLKRYLDRWYLNNSGNEILINKNMHVLAKHVTIPRSQIFEMYGSVAYSIIDEYHEKSVKCRRKLYDYSVTLVRKELQIPNQLYVLGVILNNDLETKYVKYGIEGLNYGDPTNGIMDYIEGTNDFQGAGLIDSGFTPNTITLQELVEKLKQLLVYGNINAILT